ncbi:O-antigen ligase family protein [Acholeplasma equirhinis]|uniref:O-antigen ligase family protein n=1 Tax=Acholeplasma equirhinis TaxID=555393 RepID=UPI00197AE808|nr:O-antigen ligase family protein [Acholeplasma equirhinis]MBN3489952.1 O-antigen ligase family protein [Acholeplasma equirhinis]
MKTKIEAFLGGHIYPFLVGLISFTIWSYRFYIPETELIPVTLYSLLCLIAIPFFIVLFFFKNTVYSIPILFGALFSIGVTQIDIDSIHEGSLVFLSLLIIVAGMITHFIKYKVQVKLKSLGISMILVAAYFIIPQFYTPVNEVSLLLSSLGLMYGLLYFFYANTVGKNETKYLMRILSMMGLLLSFQLVAGWINGFTYYEGNDIITDFIYIFPDNFDPGWGNINDLTILMVLATSVVMYYLHKYPKNIFPWLYLGWSAFWIFVTGARGSVVTISLLSIIIALYTVFKHDKRQLKNLSIAIILVLILIWLLAPVVKDVWNAFFNSLDFDNPDTMLTGRITLWIDHENSAWNEFLRYPFFGRGWLTTEFWLIPTDNRITMYHSTFFHVLATGGIFGILVLIYHFFEIGKLFKKNFKNIAVSAFFISYLLTQLHGLIDNTQYMFMYSIITYSVFAVFSNIEVETNNLVEA